MAPTRIEIVTTDRLTIRRLTIEDEDDLIDLDSNSQVMRYINGGTPTPPETIRTRILPGWLKWYERTDRAGFWAIEDNSDQRFLGWVHLRPDRMEKHEHELGYRLVRRIWGQGYATEAASALIRHAFEEWEYDRIVARSLRANVASTRVMEKCGLRFESNFEYPERILPA